MTSNMLVRTATTADWPGIWAIFAPVVRAGDTFCYEPRQSEAQARETWLVPSPGRVTAAVVGDRVLGTANMYANRPGPGAHIASGNVMVDAAARGRGVGHALLVDMLDWARRRSFDGVQFNAVAASNTRAIRLYERVGFRVVGTVPGAFAHPTLGKVSLHVMYATVR